MGRVGLGLTRLCLRVPPVVLEIEPQLAHTRQVPSPLPSLAPAYTRLLVRVAWCGLRGVARAGGRSELPAVPTGFIEAVGRGSGDKTWPPLV